MIRDDIKAAQIAAMKAGDKARLATIRLMLAKIKDGGRQELADIEAAEVAVIEEFLPTQLDEAAATAAIAAIVAELGATSVKDMGRVMAAVKERHGAVLDMSKASGWVKAALG